MTVIKKGFGFNVGQDFARASEDMPFEYDCSRGRDVYGWVKGDPHSRLGFMRAECIRVRVQFDCLGEVQS